ncbi:MAG: hypothetical protein BVN35_22020 [Proteobacteria bacterium ST_bin11]|nr:MAG: hypothetical protein BVN35_22020 [Proteobacteria bacterium ST_bin11]
MSDLEEEGLQLEIKKLDTAKRRLNLTVSNLENQQRALKSGSVEYNKIEGNILDLEDEKEKIDTKILQLKKQIKALHTPKLPAATQQPQQQQQSARPTRKLIQPELVSDEEALRNTNFQLTAAQDLELERQAREIASKNVTGQTRAQSRLLETFGIDRPITDFEIIGEEDKYNDAIKDEDKLRILDSMAVSREIVATVENNIYTRTAEVFARGGDLIELSANDQDEWFVTHGDWPLSVVETVSALKAGRHGVIVPVKQFIDTAKNCYMQSLHPSVNAATDEFKEKKKQLYAKYLQDLETFNVAYRRELNITKRRALVPPEKPSIYALAELNPLLRSNTAIYNPAIFTVLDTGDVKIDEMRRVAEETENRRRKSGTSAEDDEVEDVDADDNGSAASESSTSSSNKTQTFTEYRNWLASYDEPLTLEVFSLLIEDQHANVANLIARTKSRVRKLQLNEQQIATEVTKAVDNYLFPKEDAFDDEDEEGDLKQDKTRWHNVVFDFSGVLDYRESSGSAATSEPTQLERNHALYITRQLIELMKNVRNTKIIVDANPSYFVRNVIRGWIYGQSDQWLIGEGDKNLKIEVNPLSSIILPVTVRENQTTTAFADLSLLKYTPGTRILKYTVNSNVNVTVHNLFSTFLRKRVLRSFSVQYSTSKSIVNGLQLNKGQKSKKRGESESDVDSDELLEWPDINFYLSQQTTLPSAPPRNASSSSRQIIDDTDEFDEDGTSSSSNSGEAVAKLVKFNTQFSNAYTSRRETLVRTLGSTASSPEEKQSIARNAILDTFSLIIDEDFDLRVLFTLTNIFSAARRLTFTFSSVSTRDFFVIANWFVRSRFFFKRTKKYPPHVEYVNVQMHINDRKNSAHRLPFISRGRLSIVEI